MLLLEYEVFWITCHVSLAMMVLRPLSCPCWCPLLASLILALSLSLGVLCQNAAYLVLDRLSFICYAFIYLVVLSVLAAYVSIWLCCVYLQHKLSNSCFLNLVVCLFACFFLKLQCVELSGHLQPTAGRKCKKWRRRCIYSTEGSMQPHGTKPTETATP